MVIELMERKKINKKNAFDVPIVDIENISTFNSICLVRKFIS